MPFGRQHLAVLLSAGLSCAQTAVPGPNRVVIGQGFLASTQDPSSGSTPWALVSHGIAEKLFAVNKQDQIYGQIAQSVSKINNLEWEVTLKSGVKFSDGTDVTAALVATCLKEQNTLNSNAQSELGTITTSSPAALKVRIVSTIQTHVMDAVLANWHFPIYKKTGTAPNFNWIYTGPWKVDTFGPNKIEMSPNMHYLPAGSAANRPQVTLQKFHDGNQIANAARNGTIDIGWHLPIDQLPSVRATPGQRVVSMEVGYHYMMFHNTVNLPEKEVRQAIDLAIDRNALTTALQGGHATRSLFPDYSPFYQDGSNMAGQAAAAGALLTQAGWVLNANGKREKNGNLLTVRLVAYPHRPGLGIMQPLIAASLTALGITVTQTMTGSDWSETSNIMNTGAFELMLWAQHTLPNGDPKWFLSNFFKTGGSNNANLARFSNTNVDGLVDAMAGIEVHSTRVTAAKTAMAAILAEVPVSNLVTPFWHVSLSDRMATYDAWGADYYVVRPDLMIHVPTPPPGTPSAGTSVSATASGILFAVVSAAAAFF